MTSSTPQDNQPSTSDRGTESAAGLRILALRCHPGSPFITQLRVKAHQDKTHGPAVFIVGLPLGMDEALVEGVFSCFGAVSRVVLHSSKRSGMVLFSDENGKTAVLQGAAAGQLIEFSPQETQQPKGVKAWVQEHKGKRPGHGVLQKQLDEWMAEYEAAQEAKQRARQAALADDGWTVVVRSKGRKRTKEVNGSLVMSGGVAKAAAAQAAKGKQVIPTEDFYRFQKRDKRRNELLDLRQRFDEDKRRVSELKAARNFKPY